MPKRKRKAYKRPRKPYDLVRIKKEDELVKVYGLKNKKEIWKADFAIGKIRNIAKKLITDSDEKKNEFIERQGAKGFEVKSIADVLGLDKEDYLKRRLQSIVVKKKIARKPNQARQFITHKHITVNGKILDSPSHLTTLKEEESVKLNIALPIKKELTGEEKKLIKEIKKEEVKVGEETK